MGGVQEECWGASLLSKQSERARVLRAVYWSKWRVIIFGVPQHASVFSPVPHIPSPTSSVPIFNLD